MKLVFEPGVVGSSSASRWGKRERTRERCASKVTGSVVSESGLGITMNSMSVSMLSSKSLPWVRSAQVWFGSGKGHLEVLEDKAHGDIAAMGAGTGGPHVVLVAG